MSRVRAACWDPTSPHEELVLNPLAAVAVAIEDPLGLLAVGLMAAAVVARLVAVERRRPRPGAASSPLRVLVGVANPRSAVALSQLAATFARRGRGEVVPVTVLGCDADAGAVARAEATMLRADATLVDEGLEGGSHLRYDASVADGILHSTVEREASLLLLGWPQAGLDDPEDPVVRVLRMSPCPVLIARLEGYRWQRIVLRVPREPTTAGIRASLRLATETAERLGYEHDLPVGCVPLDESVPADPDQLVITPVAPDDEAMAGTLAACDPLGDVLVAVCHGAVAEQWRELSSASARLYVTSVD